VTRQPTTREQLAEVTKRRTQIADFLGRALVEDLKLAQLQDCLLDRLCEAEAAERPGRMA
jgi:hypothetical protein